MIEVINENVYSHGRSKHAVSYTDFYMKFWVWHQTQF